MDTKVKQILSDHTILPDFQVGDAPYSATCDYMNNCDYICNKNIPDSIIKTNIATYNEAYVQTNSDKIISKIKILFKEKYFYQKYNLIHMINIPKKYPISQIYSALSQMIDNKEYLIDRYGRSGFLVNIGKFYLFQPIELNNKNISIFDRVVPIDYKHDTIQFDIKEKEYIKEKLKEKRKENTKEQNIVSNEFQENGFHLIKQIERDYLIATKGKILPGRQKEINWFEQCGITISNLIKDGFKVDIIDTILIEHIIDIQNFNNKLLLYQYLFSIRLPTISDTQTYLENKIKLYLEKNIINTSKNLVGIILFENNIEKIYILNSDSKWIIATPIQKEQILLTIKTNSLFIIDKFKINTLMGYISYDIKYGYTFKIKNTDLKRHTGASCDQMNKDKKTQILNTLVGYEKYKKYDNDKNKKNNLKIEKREGDTTGMIKEQMCSLIEFIMRYYTLTKKDDKIWFLNNDKYILNKIE